MKAVQMTNVGDPTVLQFCDVPEPEIKKETQIKVRLKAAGINPIDTKARGRGLFFENALPAILGCDGAGVVVDIGHAVSRFKPGDEVWFCHGGLGGPEQGNYAEYTVLDESIASFKPETLSFIEAAAAPLVILTAWESLFDRVQLSSGQTVLIHAGAGGVGHVAIQLAKSAGFNVMTTVSTDAKADFVKSLGADEIIQYTENPFVDTVNRLTRHTGVDMVFDTLGGDTFRQSIMVTRHYGDIVTLLDPGTDVNWKEARTRNLGIHFELMLTPMLRHLPEARQHQVGILDQCAMLIDQGKLKINVSDSLPLNAAAKAHEMIEAGHTQGKLVLLCDENQTS